MSAPRVIDGEVFDARAEADAIRARAREEGLAAGLLAARAGEAKRIGDAEPALVRLAVAIAEKLVRRQLTLTPEAVADVAREALALARGRRRALLRVHPDDVTRVHAPGVEVVGDASIAPGGCVVETELGRIDGRLESQLAVILRALEHA